MGPARTLRQARTARLLTVRELAAAAGCSPATVHEVEHGRRRPHFATMRRLSAALGVKPDEIVEFRQALLLDAHEREPKGAAQ